MAGPRTKTPAARPKRARSSPNLSAERVREEALRLIEAEGLDGFSTRKLGRALGVEAMAIYWYYASKDALLDAVVELLIGKLDRGRLEARTGAEPVDFLDALRRLAHAYRGLAHAYPNAFPLLATRRFATEASYSFLDELFALAEAYGLDGRTTARFYRLVASYCSGVALDELAGMRERDVRRDARATREALPRVATVFEWLGPDHYDDVFAFGLEVLLGALREHAAAHARKPAARRTSRAGARKAPG